MLVVGVVYGRDRARERPEEDEEEERKKKNKKKKKRYTKKRVSRLSRARSTSGMHDFEKSKMGGELYKKKELGMDLKLVYNDVEMENDNLIKTDDGERRDFCFSGEGTAHPLISILDSYFFYPFLRFIIM